MRLPKPVALSHLVSTMVALVCLSPLAGCRLCSESEDIDYPSYGGAWQRTTRDSGRVGSVFDSAGGKVSQLTDRRDPLPADAAERKRHGLRTEGMFDPEDDKSDPQPEAKPSATEADNQARWLESRPDGFDPQPRHDESNVRLQLRTPPTDFVR